MDRSLDDRIQPKRGEDEAQNFPTAEVRKVTFNSKISKKKVNDFLRSSHPID